MRLFVITLLFFTSLLLAAAIPVEQETTDYSQCAQRDYALNLNLTSLILNFCSNNDSIFVPSKYAQEGLWNSDAGIRIYGFCSPPQYVPEQICLDQFWYICAYAQPTEGDGHINGLYGREQCQNWNIVHRGAWAAGEEGFQGGEVTFNLMGELFNVYVDYKTDKGLHNTRRGGRIKTQLR